MGRKIKVTTLCLIALLSFSAVALSAEASAAPHWTLEGKEFTGTEKLAETVVLENYGSETTPLFTWTIDYNRVAAACTNVTLNQAAINGGSKLSIQNMVLSGCYVEGYPSKEKVLGCTVTPYNGTFKERGTLKTGALNGELVTGSNGKTYVRLTPGVGSEGDLLHYRLESSGHGACSLEGVHTTTGTMVIEVHTVTEGSGKAAKSNLGAEVSTETQKALGEEMKDPFTGYSMFAFSKFRLNLAAGKNWGVSP